MSFAKLLEELATLGGSEKTEDTLAKSMAAEDEAAEGEGDVNADGEADDRVAAAAADGEKEGDPENDAEPDGDADDGEYMGKSMTIIGEDGEPQEVLDATEILKSLHDRVGGLEADSSKAIGQLIDLVKAQQADIGELRKSMESLGSKGAGRKTTVAVVAKPDAAATDLVKSEQPEGLSGSEFLAKCLRAQSEGRISGQDVSRAEAYLNRGIAPPKEIVARVMN